MKYKPLHIITFTVFFFGLAMLSKSPWYAYSNIALGIIFFLPKYYFSQKVAVATRTFSNYTLERTTVEYFNIFDVKQNELRKIPDKRVRKHFTLAIKFANLMKTNFALGGILIIIYNTVF